MKTEQLLNTFEVYYRDYKKYLAFFENYNREQTETMKENVQELFKSENLEEDAFQFVLNTRALPNLYAKDLHNLKEKLIVAFDFVQDMEEISAETKTEIEQLRKNREKPLFIIEGDKAIEIDKEKIEYYYKTFKSPEFIKHSIELAKNILKIDQEENK